MDQVNKVEEYPREHRVTDCKLNRTTLSVPLSDIEVEENTQHDNYKKIMGQVQFKGAFTKLNLTHATFAPAKYSTSPKKTHWEGQRGTLKYLKGTHELTLKCQFTNIDPKLKLEVKIYNGADYGGGRDNQRSRTRYPIMTMGGLIAWQSKLKTTFATSTSKVEYQGVASATKEGPWVRNFKKHLLNTKEVTGMINIDNQSTLRLRKNPWPITKAKHIDVPHHFIRERAIREEMKLTYCPTKEMLADNLTKQVSSSKFDKCIKRLGMNDTCTRLSGSFGNKPQS